MRVTGGGGGTALAGRALRLLAAVLLVGPLLAACSAEETGGPAPAPTSSEPTALADYDTEGARVVRGPFCDQIAEGAVAAVLGDGPAEARSWADGEQVPVGGASDVAHEFGCSWTKPDGARVAAWVFAPPVTADRARELLREARGVKCVALPEADGFGEPGGGTTCSLNRGATLVRHAGLFDDAWLTCEVLAGSEVEARERADQWCVSVLEAAGGAG